MASAGAASGRVPETGRRLARDPVYRPAGRALDQSLHEPTDRRAARLQRPRMDGGRRALGAFHPPGGSRAGGAGAPRHERPRGTVRCRVSDPLEGGPRGVDPRRGGAGEGGGRHGRVLARRDDGHHAAEAGRAAAPFHPRGGASDGGAAPRARSADRERAGGGAPTDRRRHPRRPHPGDERRGHAPPTAACSSRARGRARDRRAGGGASLRDRSSPEPPVRAPAGGARPRGAHPGDRDVPGAFGEGDRVVLGGDQRAGRRAGRGSAGLLLSDRAGRGEQRAETRERHPCRRPIDLDARRAPLADRGRRRRVRPVGEGAARSSRTDHRHRTCGARRGLVSCPQRTRRGRGPGVLDASRRADRHEPIARGPLAGRDRSGSRCGRSTASSSTSTARSTASS